MDIFFLCFAISHSEQCSLIKKKKPDILNNLSDLYGTTYNNFFSNLYIIIHTLGYVTYTDGILVGIAIRPLNDKKFLQKRF